MHVLYKMYIQWWNLVAVTLIFDILLGVAVHYEGILAETEEVFDSTHEDNTIFSFELGKGSVIKAWDIAVKTMRVNITDLLLSELFHPISP